MHGHSPTPRAGMRLARSPVMIGGLAATLAWTAVRAVGGEPLVAASPDLVVPEIVAAAPAAGRRVTAVTPGWERTDVRHVLWLPRDWVAGRRYPVLVEYPGNGGYRDEHGNVSEGSPAECMLGYGLSGGEEFVWLCLPFVEMTAGGGARNCPTWWGDLDETRRYCIATVRDVCERHGGDASRVVLCGFSRGSIACNHLGLRDDEIAALWRAFFCHSHYDGVRSWPYPGSDRAAAVRRLGRLAGRSQWISHEVDVGPARRFVEASGVDGSFTFVAIPSADHSADWVLHDTPERRRAREWLREASAAGAAVREQSPR